MLDYKYQINHSVVELCLKTTENQSHNKYAQLNVKYLVTNSYFCAYKKKYNGRRIIYGDGSR